MPEEQQRIRYAGRNEDERIYCAQQFAIGINMLNRFGGQMSEDERNWFRIALRAYVIPEVEPTGGVEPVQESAIAQPRTAPHPTQTTPTKRK